MSTARIIFILCVATILFTYFGYPLFIWMAAKLIGMPVCLVRQAPRAVSIIIAAHNEAQNIGRRVGELRRLIEPLDPSSEIIIVSDGSTDGTKRIASEAGDERVCVIHQPANLGKAEALNTGVAAARNPIVVFGDARQKWADDALTRMLENYGDPDVGAVSGELVLEKEDGSLAGVGLYWELEKRLRYYEGLVHSSVGVTGAICSVRRELYAPLPPRTILDDVYWPLAVTMGNWRVVHDPHARAFDRLPERSRDELRRKVRTLSGNLQLLFLRPSIIVPWRNPVWFGVICHKLLRLLVPWAMIASLLVCIVPRDPWLHAMLLLQLAGYAMGITGLLWKRLAGVSLVNAASSLLVLNAAALMAWFVFFSGRCGKSWKKVAYNTAASQASSPVIAS